MRAWLVTWEWMGNSAAVADKVVAILNPRWSYRRVANLVEFLYISATASLSTAANYVKQPRSNPYQAIVEQDQFITCGHHPWLCARKVDDLQIKRSPETRLETVSWTELPRYRFSHDEGKFVKQGEKLRQRYQRRIVGPVSHEIVWDRLRGSFKPGWENYSGIVVESVPFSRRKRS